MNRAGFFGAALALALGVASIAEAQPLQPSDVPGPLQPWIGWAVDGDANYGCTRNDTEFRCTWPGRLVLNLDERGGTFALDATVDRLSRVVLPGDAGHWPRDVRADHVPVAVLTNSEAPFVQLTAGTHRIEGRFSWRALPETLQLPLETALVTLSLDGTTVPSPHRDEEGHLWLRAHEDTSSTEELLSLEVQRRIEDGVPLSITTRIVVHASGRSREVELGDVLVAGSVPASVESELPVQLSEAGRLKVQVRAGTFVVSITALVANPGASLAMPTIAEPWPEQEVWVWVPNEVERQVEVAGAPSVDPTRTSLPPEWRGAQAYLMTHASPLTLQTTRRGEQNPAPNQLGLVRELFLDPDGSAFSVRDTISGTMNRGWRLELAHGRLEHISSSGSDQLITTRRACAEGETCTEAQTGPRGLELRTSAIGLLAESRLPRDGASLPAVGWSEDMQSLRTTLNLPPGWSLFSTSGVDEAGSTWLEGWSLWGFFFVLVVSIAFARVFGIGWGIVCALGLTLSYPEENAPTVAWLALIVAIAIWRALKEGKLRRVFQYAAIAVTLVLLVQVVSFSVGQLRFALHPQLAADGDLFDSGVMGTRTEMSDVTLAAPEPPPAEQQNLPEFLQAAEDSEAHRPSDADARRSPNSAFRGRLGLLGGIGSSDGNDDAYQSNIRSSGWMDPSSVVQTGSGMPVWQHRSLQLNWSGPVRKDHVFSLHLISPAFNRLLALLRVALILALLVLVIRKRAGNAPVSPPTPTQASSVAPLAGAAFLFVLFGASAANAQEPQAPTPDMLTQLRERLTRAPECEPNCYATSHADLRAVGDTLTLGLNVEAGAQIAYPLPGPADSWVPTRVVVDGHDSFSLVRLDDGVIALRLTAGAHRVELSGPLSARDAVTLTFESEPHSLDAVGDGWAIEGMAEEGNVTSSLQLRRTLVQAREGGPTAQGVELPPWYAVTRRFDIGVTWTVSTTVRRITPPTLPVTMRVPLLPGESVTSAGIVVEGRNAVITLAQGVDTISFQSSLAPSASIELVAPATPARSDTWEFACTPLWHCTYERLAPTSSTQQGALLPSFHPWPSERLSVQLERPAPASGQSFVIDTASLNVSPGIRMTHASLTIQVRTSQSQPLTLTLPHSAEVQSLTVNGAARAVQRSGDRLTIALQPGASNVVLAWQEERGWQSSFTSPRVLLNGAPANAHLYIDVPMDRWLLWSDGPSWGPAILFWSYLVLLLLVAFGIGRSKLTPLGYRDSLLLGLGLTQMPAWFALTLVGWFVVMQRRATSQMSGTFVFNLKQVALVAYTVMAIGILVGAVYQGLVVQPDMQVAGNGSSNLRLHYYVARASETFPQATIVSVAMWVWRVVMLLWALWLAERVVRWARFAWSALTAGGGWRSAPKPPAPPAPPVPPAPEAPPLPDAAA